MPCFARVPVSAALRRRVARARPAAGQARRGRPSRAGPKRCPCGPRGTARHWRQLPRLRMRKSSSSLAPLALAFRSRATPDRVRPRPRSLFPITATGPAMVCKFRLKSLNFYACPGMARFSGGVGLSIWSSTGRTSIQTRNVRQQRARPRTRTPAVVSAELVRAILKVGNTEVCAGIYALMRTIVRAGTC